MEMYHIYNASLEINEAAFIQPAHLQWLFPPRIWKIPKREYLWSIVEPQAYNTSAFFFVRHSNIRSKWLKFYSLGSITTLITSVKSNVSNEIFTCKHKICCWSALKSNVGWSADVLWSLLQSITTFTISSPRLSFKRAKQAQQKIMLLCCINITKVYETSTGQQLCSTSYRPLFIWGHWRGLTLIIIQGAVIFKVSWYL